MIAAFFVAHPSEIVARRRNESRPRRDARASRGAISLRTLLRAQSLRGHNGIGRTSPFDCFSGIRDVGKRLTSWGQNDPDEILRCLRRMPD